jgi:hypothetical protein
MARHRTARHGTARHDRTPPAAVGVGMGGVVGACLLGLPREVLLQVLAFLRAWDLAALGMTTKALALSHPHPHPHPHGAPNGGQARPGPIQEVRAGDCCVVRLNGWLGAGGGSRRMDGLMNLTLPIDDVVRRRWACWSGWRPPSLFRAAAPAAAAPPPRPSSSSPPPPPRPPTWPWRRRRGLSRGGQQQQQQ